MRSPARSAKAETTVVVSEVLVTSLSATGGPRSSVGDDGRGFATPSDNRHRVHSADPAGSSAPQTAHFPFSGMAQWFVAPNLREVGVEFTNNSAGAPGMSQKRVSS